MRESKPSHSLDEIEFAEEPVATFAQVGKERSD